MNQSSELSEREIEILKLVATGLSNKEIAYQLKISPNTVKVHLKNVFGKIGVVSRTEAAMYAVRKGWVEAGNQAALEAVEVQERGDLTKAARIAFSPSILGLVGVGLFAAMIILVILLVNLASRGNPQVVEIVVTPTPEPVKWELVTQMPEPKKSMAYAAVDNKIYIIGGETPDGISDRVDIYDTVSGEWREGARKPTPVSEACGAYLGGKIIVAGGKKPDGTVTNVVEAYDVNEDRWESLPEMLLSLVGTACFEYEGSFHVLGGWDGETTHSEIMIYPNLNQGWKIGSQLSLPRAYFGVGEVGDRIYLVGGWDGKKGLVDISTLSLSVSQNGGNKLGSLDKGRYLLTSLGVLDRLYVIGGFNAKNPLTSSLEISSRDKVVRLIENPEGNQWYAHGSVSLGEYLYSFGGVLGDRLASGVYRLKILYTVVLPVIGK